MRELGICLKNGPTAMKVGTESRTPVLKPGATRPANSSWVLEAGRGTQPSIGGGKKCEDSVRPDANVFGQFKTTNSCTKLSKIRSGEIFECLGYVACPKKQFTVSERIFCVLMPGQGGQKNPLSASKATKN